jgi:hypothetical protein
MEMAVRSMEMAETAMETDGDGFGGTSPSRQGAGIETSVPRRRQSCRTLLEILPIVLGFSVGRLFIGGEATPGGYQGHLTTRGRGQGVAHATLWCGCPLAPLRLSFGLRPSSGKNRSFCFCFVQFREYFLCSFSET